MKNALMILVALLITLTAVTLPSKASSPTTALTITNNSSLEINSIYLSATTDDNWGPDQLNGASISPGGTQTLNISWNQPTVKVVAEDQEGCFITTTIDVSSAASWTITSSSSRNCGS